MSDYIIIFILLMIWFQGTKYSEMFVYRSNKIVRNLKRLVRRILKKVGQMF